MTNDVRTCKGPCGLTKPITDFNFKDRKTGRRHTECRSCHRLKIHCYVEAGKRVGLKRRDWMKATASSLEERLKIVNEIYWSGVVKPSITPKSPKLKKIKQPKKNRKFLMGQFFVHDPRLPEIDKKRKAALALLNNRQIEDTAGYVYLITNPLYPDRVSIGSAYNYEKRLRTYQRYDPEQRFQIEYAIFFDKDYKKQEQRLMDYFGDARINDTDWFIIPNLQSAINRLQQMGEETTVSKLGVPQNHPQGV